MRYVIIIICLVPVMITGCVSQKKFQTLETSYGQLQSNNSQLINANQECQKSLAASNSRVGSLEEQMAAAKGNLVSLQSALDKCLSSYNQGNLNISKLLDEISASNQYIQRLIEARHTNDSLLLVLSNNLTRSLSPEESKDIEVRVLKGVVYISLSDNMLYKTGEYEISDQAGAILNKIARIINDYQGYEVLIEGNTDTVPIVRANIRNNWDLSVLRGSSVVQALQNIYHVDPKRLTAGGRGEFNPIADNSTESGRYLNRRTQIIITPTLNQFTELINQMPEKKE